MTFAEIMQDVRLIIAAIPAEVDVSIVMGIAEHELLTTGGFTLHGFLTSLIASANTAFPDGRTRPYAILVLDALLKFSPASKVEPSDRPQTA